MTILDDLNRGDGPWGGNYTAFGTMPNIATNQGVSGAASGADCAAIYTAASFNATQSAQIDLVSLGSAYSDIETFVRFVDSNNFFFADFSTENGGQYRLWKRVGGTYTQIGSSVTGVGTSARTLLLDVSGASPNITLVLSADGTPVITATNQSGPESGNPGIGFYYSGGGTSAVGDNAVFGGEVVIATIPDPVDDLAGTAGDSEVALTWTAPDDGGATITDYVVQYREAATTP